ncbi:MAG: hypothetical protein ACOCXG_00750 [Nanoarchaeota archaeon]
MEFNKGVKWFIYTLAALFLSMNFAYAATNVIDVTVTENVYEEVMYNPLKAGTGLWYDSNENQSVYLLNGTILVENNHATDAVYAINLTFDNVDYVSNVVHASGYNATISLGASSLNVFIPEIAAGGNSIVTYDIDNTSVKPPLNFTTSYSGNKVFAGQDFDVTDVVENNLNGSYPVTCIYDINITQNAMTANVSGVFSNFTFISPITGSDSGNASMSADNRTVYWDTLNNACLTTGTPEDISYGVQSPADISIAADYGFTNTTIAYKLNTTASLLSLTGITAVGDVELTFDKKINESLAGDNATWEVYGNISSDSDITVNITEVTFWVSVRDGTGTGFTNPSIIDNDTIDGSSLTTTYNPGVALNNTLAEWSSTSNPWYFNYTYSSSPIVWMDLENNIIDDGIQLTNRSITYGNNTIYIKEIYVVTGYWIEISKNITRINNDTYNILITVMNLGNSPTPSNQVVQVYNFLPNTFSLVSPFVYSSSSWYDSVSANETLNDPIYNGTMYQFGILADTNPYNASLAAWDGGSNANNTWTVTFNVTGEGEFDYEDLFLTGVDPLHVNDVGSTKTLTSSGIYGVVSAKAEYLLVVAAVVLGLGALLI